MRRILVPKQRAYPRIAYKFDELESRRDQQDTASNSSIQIARVLGRAASGARRNIAPHRTFSILNLLRIEDRMASAKRLMNVFPLAMAVIGAAPSVRAARAPVTRSVQPSNSAGPISPAGYWVTEDHAWTVRIAACGVGFCGKIVGLGASPRADVLRKDIQNPDVTKRSATLCGLPVLGSFVPSSKAGVWEGGWIYNPQNGKTYQSVMEFDGGDILNVRGYVLIPLLGRNETLTRVTAPARRCTNVPGVATGASSTSTG